MKWYAVAEIDVTDPSWVRDYVADVTKIVERRGGRYLARPTQVERIEGVREPPQTFLIIEWRSKQAADAFYRSEESLPGTASQRRAQRVRARRRRGFRRRRAGRRLALVPALVRVPCRSRARARGRGRGGSAGC